MYSIQEAAITVMCTQFPSWVARQGHRVETAWIGERERIVQCVGVAVEPLAVVRPRARTGRR